MVIFAISHALNGVNTMRNLIRRPDIPQTRLVRRLLATTLLLSGLLPLSAMDLLEIFDESPPESLSWLPAPPRTGAFRPEGGHESEHYLYLRRGDTPLSITGLSIPIREFPAEGEFRYLSFAWRKWGDGIISLQLDRNAVEDGPNKQGAAYDYRFDAGEGPPAGGKALRITPSLGGNWQAVPMDLWKTFGDFTVTGITFTVGSRDAGFDAIAFARSMNAFKSATPAVQLQVAEKVEVAEVTGEDSPLGAVEPAPGAEVVKVDWAAQIKAGGVWMYPLYLCGFLAIMIATQRLLTVGEARLAPAALRRSVRELTGSGDYDAALKVCDEHRSTLADVVRFILQHRHASYELVNQTAGDIAARDIRSHLSRIYPLSLISSISPLLGLLGTIIGMVEAFGIVAAYGDEGGASILSDSISKALITTAAGLIIAIPCISIYFTLKNRIMRLASVIEVEVEELVTRLYLREGQPR